MSELIEYKRVKVRKDHKCQGCGKTIHKSEYAHDSACSDGEIYHIYECDDCYQYVKDVCLKCKDFSYCIGEDYPYGALKECQREKEKSNSNLNYILN